MILSIITILPSPAVDSTLDQYPSHSPKTSPKLKPLHPASKHPKFSLFRRKEKARSQSVRESDMKFLGVDSDAGKKGVISFPSKGKPLVVSVSDWSCDYHMTSHVAIWIRMCPRDISIFRN